MLYKYFFTTIILFSSLPLDGWSFFSPEKKIITNQRTLDSQVYHKPFTIMIDPSGDLRNARRVIDDTFERGLTMQCSQEIKNILESRIPRIRIILARIAGEITEPLQNAHFSNRLQTDFYISLHFYQTKQPHSQIYLYYVLYNPITDFWAKRDSSLTFEPYDQAYKISINKTFKWANFMLNSLKDQEKEYKYIIKGLYGVPFKPLIGITAPALAIEIGLNKKDSWKAMVEPIAQAISQIIKNVEQNKL